MLALVEVNKWTERNAEFVLFLDSKAFQSVSSSVFVGCFKVKKKKQASFNMFLLGLGENTHAKRDQS